jgi:predicted amidophosphoribosyltransferase
VESDFLACPFCGIQLRQPCPSCQRPLSPQWKTCPYCARPVQRQAPARTIAGGSSDK